VNVSGRCSSQLNPAQANGILDFTNYVRVKLRGMKILFRRISICRSLLHVQVVSDLTVFYTVIT